ncbi:ABC transporter ATP-binding protein [Methylobacterium pseudosasicola]|uniref:Peptide/nickel transport system ATP-binding protein n=1 Tax=Methylobacterium pseudosasicola TaxID=582667 RepID=A0A1I4Q5X4_9HYPH|nr:oligopeptide/dipeptide ABC transporter ATP-binding protein [Methylobacterium pseudosasicola]SFM35444.1 peptide/nickel transport system ATP-binding protein [Methylobacterium pseudosasicola]
MATLSVSDLHTHYRQRGATLRAVDGVSFTVEAGETVGLVGESGCGKSTLGKSLLRLIEPTSGRIEIDGTDMGRLLPKALAPIRRRLQMVFQDPFGSLNPRHTVGEILTGPLQVHGLRDRRARQQRAIAMLDRVGLPAASLTRYPHEFSGGQRQRLGIARALILEPDIIVCDEPVSALDLSIQAQILNLLGAAKAELGLSYLFISHDLSVVRYVADRILVMYLGRIVETGTHQSLWAQPRHPYTRALIDAVPGAGQGTGRAHLGGELPSARQRPAGCRFHARCPLATEQCEREEPTLRSFAPDSAVACHHAEL